MKVIIDTDPGHDDALALMLACLSPEIDVLAITTVAGNSSIQNTTRNAKFILDKLGCDIPIFSGAAKPIKRKLVQAVVHGKSGLEGIDPKNSANLTGDAVDQIIKLVNENPDQITLVTLGPLTNIALAINKDPIVMRKVKNIVSMGGAIEVTGNMTKFAEFNIFVDPEAADIVLSFDNVPKTLVPIDASNKVGLQIDNFKRIKNDTIREFVLKMMKPYIINIEKDTGIKAALMYDPLTIFFLLRPEICKIISKPLRVLTKDMARRGQLVVNENTDNRIDIVTDVSAIEFTKTFLSKINRNVLS